MNYNKPEVSLFASAIDAIESSQSNKMIPMFQDNLQGHPVTFGTTSAYEADE